MENRNVLQLLLSDALYPVEYRCKQNHFKYRNQLLQISSLSEPISEYRNQLFLSIQKTILSQFSSKGKVFTAVKDIIKLPALFC